jgi:large subunit ribosomal protein L25
MSIISTRLDATVRSSSGKGFARRTRVAGQIPAVVYGKHLERPLPIAVDPEKVREAIATPKKMNTVIGLKVDGKELTVLLKDYQMDPVSRELLHADFIDVRENEKVKVNVPVLLTGKADGVLNGGILSQMRRALEVWSLPGSIPQSIDVDVTALKIAQALHINDIKLPAGVEVKTHVNFTIAVITAPETDKALEAATAATAATAAAATAAAAGGAAPAAGGDKKAEGAAPAAAAGDKKAAPAKK